MERYQKLPEPVFQFPSEGDDGGMYCGSLTRGYVNMEAFSTLVDAGVGEDDVNMGDVEECQEGAEGLSPDYGTS